jgi:hypothetical protein
LTSQVANRVFGQGGSFISGTCNNGDISASSLCHPAGVTVDSGGHLFIAEYFNNRVLEYDTPLTSQVANRVFGQGGSFISGTCNNFGFAISASSLCNPIGVLVDGSGNLYVGEESNNRVLEYDSPLASAPLVGGVAEYTEVEPNAVASTQDSPRANALALAGFATGAALLLTAGGWYARKRWLT